MSEMGSANWSETASSNNASSPNGWTSGSMLPSQVEPTAREMMSALKKWWNESHAALTSSGTANAHTLTNSVARSQYYTGQVFTFIVGTTNTGSATLNVDGLGAKTIKWGGQNLVGGELTAGTVASVAYDGTNMLLLHCAPSWQNFSVSSITANANGPPNYTVSGAKMLHIAPKLLAIKATIVLTLGNSSAGILFINTNLPTSANDSIGNQLGINYQNQAGQARPIDAGIGSNTSQITLISGDGSTTYAAADNDHFSLSGAYALP